MKIHEFEQRSPEWEAIRIGKFTATDFATVANPKSKATRETLCLKKAAEIITQSKAYDSYANHNTDRGIELEAEARLKFELETGLEVREVGFVEGNKYTGVSPDGLINDNAGLELKCKDNHTHLKFLLEGDKSYKWQIQGSLYVCKREVWYFTSYNPNFPVDKQTRIFEITPDEESFERLSEGLRFCITRVEDLLEEYGMVIFDELMLQIDAIDTPETALSAYTAVLEAVPYTKDIKRYQDAFTAKARELGLKSDDKGKSFYVPEGVEK